MRWGKNGQPSHGFHDYACFGPALAPIAIAAMVASTAVSAYGAVAQGQASQQASNYQAAVARNNATIANQNADYSTMAGESQSQQQQMSTRGLLGNQKTAQASSGLDVNSGSAVDVRSSTAALGTLSALNIRNNAARRAYGYRTQGTDYTAQAGLDVMQGSNAATAGMVGATGSLLQGAGQSYMDYSALKNQGAFTPSVVS